MPHIVTLAPMGKAVFILGAGFSSAISDQMPLTNELGELVIKTLPPETISSLDAPSFSSAGLSFEAWFSWLAERQPYEWEDSFHFHQSQFFQLQKGIATAIRQRQALAQQQQFKSWLFDLIDILHHSESTVITLNYDTLFESAFALLTLTDKSGEVTSRTDITKVFPVAAGLSFGGKALPRANSTLDLLKLHGSIDWYWVPGDITGSTLEQVADSVSHTPIERKTRQAAIGGKSEFIVPPTNAKGAFFENSKTRYLWQESYNAIQQARQVVLLGYSLPLNDSALASMLSRGLSGSDSKIIVVNPEASSVAKKLNGLGVSPERIVCIEGNDSIKTFVDRQKVKVANWLADDLRNKVKLQGESPVAVGWHQEKIAGVIGASFNTANGVLTLQTSPLGSSANLHRPGAADIEGNILSSNLTLAEIVKDVADPEMLRVIEVHFPEHETRAIAGYVTELPGIEYSPPESGVENWIILRPLGLAP